MKKNKTLLISLGISRKEYSYLMNWLYLTSPGIHYAKASLENYEYDTKLINKVDENLITTEIIEKINIINPKVILFNQFYSTRKEIRDICSFIPDNTIRGIGGHDATFHSMSLSDKEFEQQYGHVDFVWQGECEKGLGDYISTLRKGGGPRRVNNLGNRMLDLDHLPRIRHDDYTGETAFLSTSRGCLPNGCDFCTTPRLYPDGWRGRSVDNVHDELVTIKNTGRFNVYVVDDNFLGLDTKGLDRALEIIHAGRELDMKLFPMTSVDQVVRADKLGMLGEFTGTVHTIFLGVENPVPSALMKIGKKVKAWTYNDACCRAIDALYANGISPFLGYINFNPDTTCEELRHSAQFLYKNNLASTFYFFINKMGILEGTKQYEVHYKNNPEFEGNYNYSFKDKDTAALYALLMFVEDEERLMDFLYYEATQLIYMNQLFSSKEGVRYCKLRKDLNQCNYDFFINALEVSIKKGSVSSIFDLIADHKKNLGRLRYDYKNLILDIEPFATYLLKEPLIYVKQLEVT